MSSHPPPVPPEQQSPHEVGVAPEQKSGQVERDQRLNRNVVQQGRQANIKQNTTNEGYQQDR
jgi:hypothetical protein